MVQKSGFFQARLSAAVLRSAALAIALLVQASPSRAEPVTLSCRSDISEIWTLRINYKTGLVERLASSGKVYYAAAATISPNAIVWSIEFLDDDGTNPPATARWKGNIDRLSGTGWIQFYRLPFFDGPVSVTCRQATQKF